jgi:hypothetical protein
MSTVFIHLLANKYLLPVLCHKVVIFFIFGTFNSYLRSQTRIVHSTTAVIFSAVSTSGTVYSWPLNFFLQCALHLMLLLNSPLASLP